MKKRKNNRRSAGESLVETLAALLIFSLATVLLVLSIQSNGKINQEAEAANALPDERSASSSNATFSLGGDSVSVSVQQTPGGLYSYSLNGGVTQ